MDQSQPPWFRLPATHIRYMVLRPATDSNEPLRCILRTAPLPACPPFEAVSYVWGDDRLVGRIECNGVELRLRANLDAALRLLRHQQGERTLWIDSICIDQDNHDEKGQQVALMGEIYRAAQRTIICLGPDLETNGPKAAALINEIHHTNQRRLDEVGSPSLHQDPSVWRALPELEPDAPLIKDPRWKAYSSVLSCSWFSRVWTVQEAALGQNVYMLWGKTEIPWHWLTAVNLWLVMRARTIWYYTKPWLNDVHLRYFWMPDLELPTFVEILARAKTLNCTDERDRIYAFLGSSKARVGVRGIGTKVNSGEETELIVPPVYTKDFREVYCDFARAWIQKGGGLSILSAAEHVQSTFDDPMIPTWVPRWDLELTNNYFGLYNPGFLASRGLDTILPRFSGERTLIVSGAVLDKVEWCSEILPTDIGGGGEKGSTDDSSAICAAWKHISDSNTSFAYQDRTRLQAFVRTLCRQAYGNETPDLHPDESAFAATLSEQYKHPQETKGDIKVFNSHAGIWASLRCLVHTTAGYYALAPQITRPGDACCVIAGMDVPVILRPGTKTTSYQFVGETFMLGMMHGEIHERILGEGLKMQELSIS